MEGLFSRPFAPAFWADTHPSLSPPDQLTVYGADSCRNCRRCKAVLDLRHIAYVWVDIDAEPDQAERVAALASRSSIPVLLFPDGESLVEPTNAELAAKLDRAGL